MMQSNGNRREFLKLSGVGIAAIAAAPLGARTAQAAMAAGRGYTGSRYGLELDGVQAGWLRSAGGGDAVADVVEEKLAGAGFPKKHLGAVKYEDITLTCGTGMSKAFYDWITGAFDGQVLRKNGAVVATDYNFRPASRLNFTNALISEVGLPALDAASKDAAEMTVKLRPEITRRAAGGPNGAPAPAGAEPAQKRWLSSNFMLKIDGLEEVCARVSKIEALVLKQKMAENSVGDLRNYQTEPAQMEVPNLVVTVAESHAQPFYDWHESFVIKGNNGPQQEKNGTLQYLAPDLRTALFTLTLRSLGIFKLAPDTMDAGSDNIRRVKAEMYVESIKFDYGPVLA